MGQALWAAAGTGFTFLMTALGAAMVFIFRKEMTGAFRKYSGVCRGRDDRGFGVEPFDPRH
jgi:hypothetical protein